MSFPKKSVKKTPLRTPQQKLAHSIKIQDMLARGYSRKRIGEELGLSETQLNRDVEKLHRNALRMTKENLHVEQAIAAEQLSHIQSLALEEFEQSKVETRLMKVKGENGGYEVVKEEVRVPGSGDHLRIALSAVSQRCELYALNDPKRKSTDEEDRASKNEEFIDEILPFLKKAREQLGTAPTTPTPLVVSPSPIEDKKVDPLDSLLIPNENDSDTLKSILTNRGKNLPLDNSNLNSDPDSHQNSNLDNNEDNDLDS